MGAEEPKGPEGPLVGASVAGKYELRGLLGAGAMGAVYEGVHIALGRRVAIKLLRPEFCESSEIAGRFRREARAASAIDSEYIAQIFDFGRDELFGLYMVIEYLQGEDLETRLVREGRLDTGEAVAIACHVARGLCRAHAVGVIHRDLKPANVFLTRRENGSLLAKILDFGISKIEPVQWAAISGVEAGAEPTLTEFGTTLGTPQYMSPEQCLGRPGIDARTDVWSLCAVLYEMLAGRPAISDAGGFLAVMERIVSKDVAPLAECAPWVPAELARVVDDGLVRDRRARIRDVSTLADRLLGACRASSRAEGASDERRRTESATSLPPVPPLAPDDASPPSSAEDGVERFMRRGELPVPVGRGKGAR